MTKDIFEIILFVPSALYTGYIVFIAGALQNVMNKLDTPTFQTFLCTLDKTATRSPYAILTGILTFIGMFPYFIFYGFNNWWYTAGLIVFFIASAVSKSLNLPIYKNIASLSSTDTSGLGEQRSKLQSANRIRASVQFVSLVLMVIGLVK